MNITDEEYRLPFFTENSFVRRRCKICNSYFWTQNTDLDNCDDAPCKPYTFLGKPPTKRVFKLEEMREAFLSFFEANGHTRIKPYPVVARWREDLFVTIASIADFQPFVTEGIIPPPANPLVISQPCLRFNDIDNVGLTGGRHFTIFEMGGAHAFNYPNKQIYWKNETVRLHHTFVTDVLGVKSELVTYKEGVWSGGGNAGPDVEGCINGLEVSTLVFMQYKVVGNQFMDMPIKIVDTGYGMERYTWLSQGSPSGFHAIYGPVLEKVMGFAGLGKVDTPLMTESTRYSALMNIETSSDKIALRKKVANSLGVDWAELDRLMTLVESAYAVTDHTKALVFMLAEGVVPSNAKTGYLTRLLLRRAYRLLRQLGIEDRLPDIVEMQIERWSPSFQNIKEMYREILEAISVEEEKYRSTLKRGVELSRKIAAELEAEGKTELPAEELVELYDSHGIPPEIVKEAVEANKMKVVVPENFYGMIAQRHISPQAVSAETIRDELEKVVLNLPPTTASYYADPYAWRIKSRILNVFQGKYVVLDETPFYPKGGGQDSDRGFLEGNKIRTKVVNVSKIGNVIVHEVENMPFAAGEEVAAEVLWDRRVSLMRHHTSTHIVLGAARRTLGQHVWQAGAEKEADRSRLDISHWKQITPEELCEIEGLANATVIANIPVEVSLMMRGDAEKEYGFRLYQGGVVPGERIRVVRIGSWDVEACGGLHVKSTGEIGLIKVLRTERIQDGVERIIFASGSHAVRYVQQIEDNLKKIAETLNAPFDETVHAVEAMCVESKRLTRQVELLIEKRLEYETAEMFSRATSVDGLPLAVHVAKEVDTDSLIKVANSLTKKEPKAVVVMCGVDKTVKIVVMAGEAAVGRGVNAGVIASSIAKALGGGGGGRPNFGQGGGTQVDKVDDALKAVEAIVRKQL